jgi:hypothetical protein
VIEIILVDDRIDGSMDRWRASQFIQDGGGRP